MRDKIVLDLGCAEGLHSLYLAHWGGQVLGVDHRASVIARARETQRHVGIQGATFLVADAREKQFWSELPPVDVAVAWGLLHRVGDIFALLSLLSRASKAISLEWRTPLLPFLMGASFATHSISKGSLDPMNLPDFGIERRFDEGKIEGAGGFWDPTPGAVKTILSRMGFHHSRVLGYGERLQNSGFSYPRQVARSVLRRRGLPSARIHMVFASEEETLSHLVGPVKPPRVPEWDEAISQKLSMH